MNKVSKSLIRGYGFFFLTIFIGVKQRLMTDWQPTTDIFRQ